MDSRENWARIAEENAADRAHNASRISISSDVSSYTTDGEYATAQNSVQRESSSSGGGGGSGLGISGIHNNRNSIATTSTTTTSDSRRASAPQLLMGTNASITATAAEARAAREREWTRGRGGASSSNNWPGEVMRQTHVRVESRELDDTTTTDGFDDKLSRLDAELRRRTRSQYTPRDGRWTAAGDHEALSDLTAFLRNVTPPPENFMSVPSPVPTTTPSMGSGGSSSLRRRNSRTTTTTTTKRRGALMRVVRLFTRAGKMKVLQRSPSVRSAVGYDFSI